MTDRPLPLTAGYSHLFRGIRLSLPRAGVTGPLRPAAARLAFSDGVEVAAELLAAADGELLLSVPAYRTAAGNGIDAALWPVLDVADNTDPGLLTMRLGPRLV